VLFNPLPVIAFMKRVVAWMLGAFVLAQAIALAVGSRFIAIPEFQVLENPGDPANAVVFFAYILFSAIVLLFVLKYYRGKLLFTLIEIFLMVFTLQTLFSLAMPELHALVLAIIIVAAKFKVKHLRSLLLLIATSVVGALIGTWIDLLPAIILAVLLSAYDIIAVFYTKHMIALAKGLDDREASFSISFALVDEKKVREGKKGMKSALEAKPDKSGNLPEWHGKFIELGTGDMVVPAVLTVAALKQSFPLAIACFAGSIAGLLLLFYLLEKRHGYWPALPPIVGGCLAGMALFTIATRLL